MTDKSLKDAYFYALIGGFILLLVMGARQALGLYLEPISRELSLGRESFALAMALANLFWGIGAPITGSLSDKYGAMPVLIAGGLSYTAGLYCLGSASGEAQLLIGGVLIGLGLSAAGFTVVLGTVGRRAPTERRDQLLTYTSLGSAFGLWLAIPFTKTLIDVTTLATSLFILSAIISSIVVLAVPFRRKQPTTQSEEVADSTDSALYVRHGFGNRNYLFLLAGFFVCGFHVAFVAVHLPAFLEDKTGDPANGSFALALIGFANVFGTLAAGYAGEKLTRSRALALLYLARVFVFLGFWLLPMTLPNIYVLSLAMGFFWLGTVPLTSGLVAAIYGTKWLSLLFGIVFFSHQLGSFLGSWLGGRVFDLTGSYDIMWQSAALLALISALLHMPIREQAVIVGARA